MRPLSDDHFSQSIARCSVSCYLKWFHSKQTETLEKYAANQIDANGNRAADNTQGHKGGKNPVHRPRPLFSVASHIRLVPFFRVLSFFLDVVNRLWS